MSACVHGLLLDLLLLALVLPEVLVVDELFPVNLVDLVVVKHSRLGENLLERSNDEVQRLEVVFILLLLVLHDLSNWDREHANQLAGHALEDLVVDAARHRWCIKVVYWHWHIKADD